MQLVDSYLAGVAVDCFNYYYIILLLYFVGEVLKGYPRYAIIVTTKILYYIIG